MKSFEEIVEEKLGKLTMLVIKQALEIEQLKSQVNPTSQGGYLPKVETK